MIWKNSFDGDTSLEKLTVDSQEILQKYDVMLA